MSTSLNPLCGQANSIITEISNDIEVIGDHIHSIARIYPTLAAGIDVTANGAPWTLGSAVEVIPASGVGDIFDIHHINIEDVTQDGVYELVLYGDGSEICRARFLADSGHAVPYSN